MPTAPVQIIANASSSAPAAPVQVAANGSGGSPAAPPTVSSATAALDPGVTIGGTLSLPVPGYLRLVQIDDGLPVYGTHPLPLADVTEATVLSYYGGRWHLDYYATGSTGPRDGYKASAGAEATPDLAGGWAPDPDSDEEPTGTPTITLVTKAAPPVTALARPRNLITVGGTLTPAAAAGMVAELPGLLSGGKAYYDDYSGDSWLPNPPNPPGKSIEYDGARWVFLFYSGGVLDPTYRWVADAGAEDSPLDAAGWVGSGGGGFTAGTGTPDFTAGYGTLPPRGPSQITANGSGSTPAAPPVIV